MALAVLSGGPPRELLSAVAAGDTARLQAVPGIGKRTAERIVVELREKVAGRRRRRPDRSSLDRRPARARTRGPARARLLPSEIDSLLAGAPGDTPEALIAHALKVSRR